MSALLEDLAIRVDQRWTPQRGGWDDCARWLKSRTSDAHRPAVVVARKDRWIARWNLLAPDEERQLANECWESLAAHRIVPET
jgi:hypothetical protein